MALFSRSRGSSADDFELVQLPPEPRPSGRPAARPPEPVPAAAPGEPTNQTDQTDQTDEPDLPPSRMRGTEPLYGYVVGLELVVIAILTLVIHSGKGAPKHPQTGLQIAGLVVSIAYFAVLQRRSRTLTAFAAIVAAFIVTLPAVPDALRSTRVFVLAIPLAYGLIITQRQRKATGLTMRGTRKNPGAAGGGAGSTSRRDPSAKSGPPAGGRRGGRGRGEPKQPTPTPAGPRASARYTPPKPKRGGTRTR